MTSIKFLFGLLLFAQVHATGETGEVLYPFEAVEPHMGTLFRIKLYAGTEAHAQAAFHSAFERVRQLDETLSDYQPASALSRATRGPVHQSVTVDTDLFRVLSAAEEFAAQSEGAFDMTLGPLTHLWRTGRKLGVVPDNSLIQTAFQRCGYRKLHLDIARQSIRTDVAGMELDAGGIAKGYAVDQALATLRAAGITQALVAASGDLAFGDAPPGKPGWSIGIDSFDSAGKPFTRILMLANQAVSTSGDTEQHLDSEGKRYSHILDGRTGRPLTSNLTVTVAASSGMEADAAATAISVLGAKKGFLFADRRPGMAALIVDRTGGTAAILESTRFQSLCRDVVQP